MGAEHHLDRGSVYTSKNWLSTLQNSTQNHAISNRGTFCNFSLKTDAKMNKTYMKHLLINVPQNSPKRRCLGCISKQTGQALLREENKVEFLEKQFHKEKLSFAHKKKTELSFEHSQQPVQ